MWKLHPVTSPQSCETLSRESSWQRYSGSSCHLPAPQSLQPPQPQFLHQSITPIFPLLWSPGPRRCLDLYTGHLLCLSWILHAPPKGRTLLRIFLICTELQAVISDTHLCSQIWTLPLESTLSQKGKSCCFCPEGVLSTPLLSPSSVFWNFLECQTATPLWILLVNPSIHL